MREDCSRAGMLHQHQLLSVPELGSRASSGPMELILNSLFPNPAKNHSHARLKCCKGPSGADTVLPSCSSGCLSVRMSSAVMSCHVGPALITARLPPGCRGSAGSSCDPNTQHHLKPCGNSLGKQRGMQPAGKAAHQQRARVREVDFFWRKTAGAFAMPLLFSTRGMEVLKESNQDKKKSTLE